MADTGANTLASIGRGNLKPRLRLKIGEGGKLKIGPIPETIITFPISANVMKSNWFSADRFKIVCSLYADPEQSIDFWEPGETGGKGLNVLVEIMFEGYPGFSDWKQVFRGAADRIEFDLHKGTVTIIGRNFFSLLLDSQRPDNPGHVNIAEAITKIADAHGLKMNWGKEGPPTGDFGQEIQKLKVNFTTAWQHLTLSEADQVTRYASFLGRTAFERNGELFVIIDNGKDVNIWECQGPEPQFNGNQADGPGIGHTTKLGPSNSIGLKFTHDYQYTFYTQTVLTNHVHHKNPEEGTAAYKFPPDPPKGEDANPFDRRYYLETQNLTEEDAKKWVENFHNVSNFREWLIEWKIAGPDLLDAEVADIVNVSHLLGSFLEGPYLITSIEYDISFSRGFVQIIKGVYGKTGRIG